MTSFLSIKYLSICLAVSDNSANAKQRNYAFIRCAVTMFLHCTICIGNNDMSKMTL